MLGLVCCGGMKDALETGFFAQVDVVLSFLRLRPRGFGSFSLDRKRRNLVGGRMRQSLVFLLQEGLAYVLVLFGFSRIVFFFLSLFVASRLVLM